MRRFNNSYTEHLPHSQIWPNIRMSFVPVFMLFQAVDFFIRQRVWSLNSSRPNDANIRQ